jgi:hypothetical protein
MIRKPAHKSDAGQIKTLGDYIVKVEQSENPPKKLSVQEWIDSVPDEDWHSWGPAEAASAAWKASRDNL